MSKKEFRLLNEIIIVDEKVEESINRAKLDGSKYRLKFSYDELEELAGFLATAANYEKSPKEQERLDNLCTKVEGLLRLPDLVKKYGKTRLMKKKRLGTKSKVYVFDVWVDSRKTAGKPLREIGISGSKSLYNLAKIIVKAFGFHFDHCFGFYDNLKNYLNSKTGYEFFVDIGEEPLREGFGGVKKTKISQAFRCLGEKMLFLFDYGDNWHFIVELKEIREALSGESLPAILKSVGEAPIQYSHCEEEIDEDEVEA